MNALNRSRHRGRRLAALLLVLIAGPSLGEIYRWVDANGVTHFSEKKPASGKAKEISAQVKQTGNLVTFTDPGPIEFYQPVRTRNRGPAKVTVDIETFGYEISDTERKRIDEQVRGLYDAYVRWFDWSTKPTYPVTIKIFGKYKLFEEYQVKTRGRFVTNRSHYSPHNREILMLGSSFAEETLQLLLHETSHAVMDMQVRWSTKWLNEGVAGMFEGLTYKRGEHFVRWKGAWSEKMFLKLREGSLEPLEKYLAIPDTQWGSEAARVENTYYMIAWSLARFLINSEKGMSALATALHSHSFYQKNPESLSKILGDAYPGGIRQLDSDWRAWIQTFGAKRGNKR